MPGHFLTVIHVLKHTDGFYVRSGLDQLGPFDSLRAAYVAAVTAKWSGGGHAVIRIDPAAVRF